MEMGSQIANVVTATGIAWAGSAIGACAAWLPRQPGARMMAAMLGLAAGVMIAATLLSLLPQAKALHDSTLLILAAFAAGAVGIWLLDLAVPHQHPGAPEPDHSVGMQRHAGILIAGAIVIHNIPEGAAVGAFAMGEGGATGSLVWAIALHNIIEGVLVAFPLRAAGFSTLTAFLVAQGAGAVEFVSGLAAASMVGLVTPLLPVALAMAGGAMIFVVFEELLPEAHRHRQGNIASLGAMVGVGLVLWLG